MAGRACSAPRYNLLTDVGSSRSRSSVAFVRTSLLVLLIACHAGKPLGADAELASPGADSAQLETSTLAAETERNTSASPLFVDDYHDYNTTAQTGNSNGDFAGGAISRLPLATLAGSLFVETQTWFCHLTSNEQGARLVADAQCGSHIDVGYNSDDPAQIARQVAELRVRGVGGAIMDWAGKDSRHDGAPGYYPTGSGTDHTTARSSGEIATNAIYELKAAAEAAPGFRFAVMEDEGITNCRKGWSGGCACWPAYGSTCNETSQVISDLSYIATHWASSPAYYKLDGKPVVLFFAPDYNACPTPGASDCQTIDWNAVHSFVGDQVWIFENKGGFAHAYSAGGFGWLSTTLYPGSDATYGLGYVKDYDHFALSQSGHVVASAFKGFDDGVTDGWNYGDGSHTRYIEQRCGLTWLATLAQVDADFAAGADALQLVTWDDYEEATELETGIDTCIRSIDAQVTGTRLAWSIAFGPDLTGGATGDEQTIDHYTVWASPDGQQLVRVAPDVASGTHELDLAAYPPPGGAAMLFVQAVGKPFLAGAMSAPITLP